MFSLALLVLASSAAALVIPRATPPATYDVEMLEPYNNYHNRYMELDCEAKHDTSFFAACCHPMLATENLKDNRPPECTPSSSASSSAAQAEPTSTVQTPGDPDCDDDQSSSTADPTPTSAPVANVASDPKPTPSPSPSSSSSYVPTPSPSSSAAPAPSPSPASSNDGFSSDIVGSVYSDGIGTFFLQNGVAGNCGTVHSDQDFIVALQTDTYANGIHCGKKVKLMDTSTGHIEIAVVADSCPSCENPNSVDLSEGLFERFADLGQGIFSLQWGFME